MYILTITHLKNKGVKDDAFKKSVLTALVVLCKFDALSSEIQTWMEGLGFQKFVEENNVVMVSRNM